MFEESVVRLGNWVTRLRKARVRPEELLLLFPHCMQYSDCPHNIVSKLDNCRRCGKCKVKDIIELGERLGVKFMVASGGREAARDARQPEIKAVLAVACEKELAMGMFAVLPKPVVGVVNLRPHGPCKDTDCDMAEVEAAVKEFLLEDEETEIHSENNQ